MNCVDKDARDAGALPDIDALVAGTVALMTAWADPCPLSRLAPDPLRCVLARKVVSNLCFLKQHPLVRPELRQVLAQAHVRWVGLVRREGAKGTTHLLAADQPVH